MRDRLERLLAWLRGGWRRAPAGPRRVFEGFDKRTMERITCDVDISAHPPTATITRGDRVHVLGRGQRLELTSSLTDGPTLIVSGPGGFIAHGFLDIITEPIGGGRYGCARDSGWCDGRLCREYFACPGADKDASS